MTIMLTVGAVAMAVASLGSGPLLVLGTIGTFTGAWGWSGLLFLSLVRSSPASPGAVAGIGLTGLAVGNGLGPFIFGATAENISFPAAWLLASILVGAGAIVLHRARASFDEDGEAP
jgi:predicted MFS family arabinose efflux permease